MSTINKNIFISILVSNLITTTIYADSDPTALPPAVPTDTTTAIANTAQNQQHFIEEDEDTFKIIRKNLGINYFSTFFGPGLHKDTCNYSPTELGLPNGGNGLWLQKQVSFKYKFSKNLSFNTTFRFNVTFNNYSKKGSFKVFRWETPRLGVSTTFIKGKDWLFAGSIDTEMPYFMPDPLAGYQARERKALLTPGMSAMLQYEPANSRWSIFSTLDPRYYFYSDNQAVEKEFSKSGRKWYNKPNLTLSFRPTINYLLFPKIKLTIGTVIDYRKQVISKWNPFHLSLVANGNSTAWRLNPIPINIGISYEFNKRLTIYPHISAFPINAQRVNAENGDRTLFEKTCYFGVWLRGVLL
jgi:hypothetical protein